MQRVPQAAEQPEDNQFFTRDDKNAGTLLYRGTLKQSADAVFLRVYADDKLFHNESGKPTADNSYNLSARLKPGLVQYRTEFGTKVGKTETVLHTAANLVCGDAYLIDGQSNAEATDIGQNTSTFTSPWIRSYGSTSGSPDGARLARWRGRSAPTKTAASSRSAIGAWSWLGNSAASTRCRSAFSMARSAARTSTSTNAIRPIRPMSPRSTAACCGEPDRPN